MLLLLVNYSGKVLTHQFIQNEILGNDSNDGYQYLRVSMAGIRRKIEDDTSKPRYIITEIGVGYRFAGE